MAAQTKQKDSIWSVPFVLLMVINFFDSMCFMMLRSMMTPYALDIGLTDTLAGALVSIMSIASLVMRPVAGRLVDVFNNKRVMTFAYIGTLITMLLYFVAKSFWLLMAVRLLNGIFYGVSAVVTVTIVGSMLPQNKVGSGIGMFGMGLVVSVTFSSMVGIFVYSFGSTALFGASAACALICLVLSLFVPDVRRKMEKKQHASAKETIKGLFAKEAIIPAALHMIMTFGQAAMGVFLIVYFDAQNAAGVHIGSASLFFVVWGIALVLARPIAGKLYDRIGLVPVMVICMVCFGAFNLIISWSTNPLLTYFAAILGSIGYGGAIPALQAAAFSAAPLERKGAANSTEMMGNDIGSATGSYLIGWVVSLFASNTNPSYGYQMGFRLSVVPITLAIVISLLLIRHPVFGLRSKRIPPAQREE